jgi:meso-butanediol dehydrogenase/(S,S)-butanediol dehydrogenase/diacetyl reductase
LSLPCDRGGEHGPVVWTLLHCHRSRARHWRAIGEALLDEGADVCFADIDGDKVAEVAASNRAPPRPAGGKVTHASVDVTDRDAGPRDDRACRIRLRKDRCQVQQCRRQQADELLDVTEENWNFIMGVNGLGCLIGMQEAARQMIAQGTGGKIINTASIASRQGFDNVAPYCASKFAVVSLTQSARAISPSTTSP